MYVVVKKSLEVAFAIYWIYNNYVKSMVSGNEAVSGGLKTMERELHERIESGLNPIRSVSELPKSIHRGVKWSPYR